MMAVIKGTDLISVELKRQFENGKFVGGEEDQSKSSLDSRLFSSASRVLGSKVEFETSQVQSYNVLANLKEKYKLLLPPKKVPVDVVSASSSKISSSLQADKHCGPESGGSQRKGDVRPSPIDSSAPPVPKVALFPEDNVKLGWQGNEPIGAGMINLGNTCYLNSTLQALFHVPSFCNWLKSETEHNGFGKCDQAFISGDMCLICAMASTLRISQTHTGSVMKPVLIYGRLKSICKHLSHGHQEDAHEFLRFLIEGMERCYLLRFKGKKLDNLTKETTPLHRIFGGYLRNEVVCHSCGTTSTTFQLFQDLFLDIRHTNSLMESMQAFFSRERLEGDDRDDSYKCEKCKRKGNCSKRVYVQTPPKVLCFQLKRFTAMGKKIMKHISYPLKLDLSPFVYLRSLNKNGDIISPLPKVRRPVPYKLMSVVSHFGSAMNCGHYTAVGRSAKGSYFSFDDSLVRPSSLNSTLGACAYILMYEMETGWNVGFSNSNGERINKNSLRPSKSLSELSKLSDPQIPLYKLLIPPEQKANSLLEIRLPQHSKTIRENVAPTATWEVKSEVAKSSSSSSVEAEILKPEVAKPEVSVLLCKSSSVQSRATLNGSLSNNNTNIPTSMMSPSAVPCKRLDGSNPSNSSPNQIQDTSDLIKRQLPLQSVLEGKVKKDAIGLLKESDSGPRKALEPKNLKSSSNPLCDIVKQKSTQEELERGSPSKESTKDQKRTCGIKRKLSISCMEDDQPSPFPHKKQLTLPDLLNRKNSQINSSTQQTKIKTLKDWLEIRGTTKGESTTNKRLHQSKMVPQVQAVISTLSGWKVTDQSAVSSNPISYPKISTVLVKRKKEVVAACGENKKKKFDQVTNVELWRTLFKKKVLGSKMSKKMCDKASKKIKQKEKSEVDCAPEPPDSIGGQKLFQKV